MQEFGRVAIALQSSAPGRVAGELQIPSRKHHISCLSTPTSWSEALIFPFFIIITFDKQSHCNCDDDEHACHVPLHFTPALLHIIRRIRVSTCSAARSILLFQTSSSAPPALSPACFRIKSKATSNSFPHFPPLQLASSLSLHPHQSIHVYHHTKQQEWRSRRESCRGGQRRLEGTQCTWLPYSGRACVHMIV